MKDAPKIEELWKRYKGIMGECPEVQYAECRRAFMAGAKSSFAAVQHVIISALDESECTEDDYGLEEYFRETLGEMQKELDEVKG